MGGNCVYKCYKYTFLEMFIIIGKLIKLEVDIQKMIKINKLILN